MSERNAGAQTRVAARAPEAGRAGITGLMTAAQCERFVAAHRTASDADELASRAARRVSVHGGEDGSGAIRARLPAADGGGVAQARRAPAGHWGAPPPPHAHPPQ